MHRSNQVEYKHFKYTVPDELHYSAVGGHMRTTSRKRKQSNSPFRAVEKYSMTPKEYWNHPPRGYQGTHLQYALQRQIEKKKSMDLREYGKIQMTEKERILDYGYNIYNVPTPTKQAVNTVAQEYYKIPESKTAAKHHIVQQIIYNNKIVDQNNKKTKLKLRLKRKRKSGAGSMSSMMNTIE